MPRHEILDVRAEDAEVWFTLRDTSDGEIRTGRLGTGELWTLIRTMPATRNGKVIDAPA